MADGDDIGSLLRHRVAGVLAHRIHQYQRFTRTNAEGVVTEPSNLSHDMLLENSDTAIGVSVDNDLAL
jgi:hypothetical protein